MTFNNDRSILLDGRFPECNSWSILCIEFFPFSQQCWTSTILRLFSLGKWKQREKKIAHISSTSSFSLYLYLYLATRQLFALKLTIHSEKEFMNVLQSFINELKLQWTKSYLREEWLLCNFQFCIFVWETEKKNEKMLIFAHCSVQFVCKIILLKHRKKEKLGKKTTKKMVEQMKKKTQESRKMWVKRVLPANRYKLGVEDWRRSDQITRKVVLSCFTFSLASKSDWDRHEKEAHE